MVIAFSGTPVCLGVFTDVQYAEKPDKTLHELYGLPPTDQPDELTSTVRNYSQALPKAAKAINHFNSSNVTATLHLGDIIDGNSSLDDTKAELCSVIHTFEPLKSPILHVLGNHCLTAGREHILKSLGLPKTPYYTCDISSRWRIIVIDTVDVSVSREESHPLHKEAQQFLSEHSGDPNAQVWNGGMSSEQKEWLRSKLVESRTDEKLVIICGHIPVCMPESFGHIPAHVMYDFESITSIFNEFKDVVKAYFAGHYHRGGYTQRNGIHYVIFESILDSKHPDGSWGLVRLYNDGITVDGHGDMSSRELPI